MFHRVFVLAILCCSFDSIKCSQRHIALVDIVRMGEDYHGHIHVDGNPIKLNLTRPGTTIFTPEFRLTAATADQWGNVIYEDITPTVNLTHVEESIYEDEEANAIFRVHHVDGKIRMIRMHGIMDNIHIAHDGEDHFAVIHDYSTPPKASGKDYIPIEGPLEFDSSVEPRQMSTVYPELYITVDNKMWRDLKQDNSYTLAYLSVFMRGVNNRYKTVSDPSIQYRVVTATILNVNLMIFWHHQARNPVQ
ncbi:unnamed protein product [Allacma fusca]|uniref:Uncharacterized protein n=1 Tax=Allacma fusca TaxID=39272 RepID=A0A8J2LQD4_9HEXA|nr:unnamed protein product [Allacma fusca]